MADRSEEEQEGQEEEEGGQCYIFPVARVWQAHTSPKPPFPITFR